MVIENRQPYLRSSLPPSLPPSLPEIPPINATSRSLLLLLLLLPPSTLPIPFLLLFFLVFQPFFEPNFVVHVPGGGREVGKVRREMEQYANRLYSLPSSLPALPSLLTSIVFHTNHDRRQNLSSSSLLLPFPSIVAWHQSRLSPL